MWQLIGEQTGSWKTCLVPASTSTSVNDQHQREDAGVLQCSRETWAAKKTSVSIPGSRVKRCGNNSGCGLWQVQVQPLHNHRLTPCIQITPLSTMTSLFSQCMTVDKGKRLQVGFDFKCRCSYDTDATDSSEGGSLKIPPKNMFHLFKSDLN